MAIPETKQCQNCKSRFVLEDDDFAFYQKIQVPPPTFCPECRLIRRMSFWNERFLFRKKEARTGSELFSTYPEAAPNQVYDHDFWWSDGWNPLAYGRGYDFTKPFFEQFQKLLYEVPWPARSIWRLVHSDYSNNASKLKNCYLCFDCDESEDCLYGVAFRYSKGSMDFGHAAYLERCYELFSCDHSFQTFFSNECSNCRDVWFSQECVDCSHCFGCVNLRHKQYHIFNVPYSREDYLAKVRAFDLGSYGNLLAMKDQVREFRLRFPVRYMHGVHNEHVVAEYTYHAKNVRYCYALDKDIRDLKYCQRVVNGTANAYDYTHWGDNSELIYEAVTCGENCRKLRFCYECWPACEDLEYCIHCHSSTNCFGCVGLKKQSYCILNRQYTEGEYRALRAQIIEHMNSMPHQDARGRTYRYGEFFPTELSPFAYNETIAHDFFPLTEAEVERNGFTWRKPQWREHEVTLPAAELPDHINGVGVGITKETIGCALCRRAYRVLPAELEFYKKFSVPLPRLCHNCRFTERMRLRNPIRWWRRQCQCAGSKSDPSTGSRHGMAYQNTVGHPHHGTSPCPNSFETTYAPDRPQIVYCEQCYRAEVA